MHSGNYTFKNKEEKKVHNETNCDYESVLDLAL